MTNISKRFVRGLFATVVLPIVLSYRLFAVAVGSERAFPGFSQFMAGFPGIIGEYLRFAFYRRVFPSVGENVVIGYGTIFSNPSVHIGDMVYIGAYGVIGAVSIEDDVLIGSRVSILNGNRQHGIERLDCPIREQPGEWPRVTIGRDSWIGDGATVMVDIAEQTVIGAASVVAKPLPPRSIAVGNPARVLRERTAGATPRHPG